MQSKASVCPRLQRDSAVNSLCLLCRRRASCRSRCRRTGRTAAGGVAAGGGRAHWTRQQRHTSPRWFRQEGSMFVCSICRWHNKSHSRSTAPQCDTKEKLPTVSCESFCEFSLILRESRCGGCHRRRMPTAWRRSWRRCTGRWPAAPPPTEESAWKADGTSGWAESVAAPGAVWEILAGVALSCDVVSCGLDIRSLSMIIEDRVDQKLVMSRFTVTLFVTEESTHHQNHTSTAALGTAQCTKLRHCRGQMTLLLYRSTPLLLQPSA